MPNAHIAIPDARNPRKGKHESTVPERATHAVPEAADGARTLAELLNNIVRQLAKQSPEGLPHEYDPFQAPAPLAKAVEARGCATASPCSPAAARAIRRPARRR